MVGERSEDTSPDSTLFPYKRAPDLSTNGLVRAWRFLAQVAGFDQRDKALRSRKLTIEASAAGTVGNSTTDDVTIPDGVGICLSGGGIRAASFGLGALQSLGEHGLLHGETRAKYLTAVSGGSYIATAFALVAESVYEPAESLHLDTPRHEGNDQPIVTPPTPSAVTVPFAHGSPEEMYLRDHTLYLTHGPGGVFNAVWRMFLGIVFNLAMTMIGLSIFAMPLGYLYRRLWPALQAGCPKHCPAIVSYHVPPNLVWGVLAALALSMLLGLAWLLVNTWSDKAQQALGLLSAVMLIGAAVTALLFIGFPFIIHLARPIHLANPVTTYIAPSVHSTRVVTTVTGATGLFGVLIAWLATAQRSLNTQNPTEKDALKEVTKIAKKHPGVVLNSIATVAGPILVLIAALFLSYWASAYSPFYSPAGHAIFIGWIIALVIWIVLWYRVDVTSWSLFPFYRRRLSASFVLERVPAKGAEARSPYRVGKWTARKRPYEKAYLLSEFQSDAIPEVIICAAANISQYGETPTGSNVSSFTFSPLKVGGPLVDAVPTVDFENALRGKSKHPSKSQARFVTYPSAMAISSAAFSPSMGRVTKRPFRFFIALLNLRLGVWVPNPRYLSQFANRRRTHPLLPRWQYLVREMLGINHISAPFLYVTDGGHYENLGLVELLRRRCTEIWCIDAAGDEIDSFNTLGLALRLAESELKIRVDIYPYEEMAPTSKSPDANGVRYVKKPFCTGKIHYPDENGDNSTEKYIGVLHFVKAGVPQNAPMRVVAFAASTPRFPCDPTLDQLYDADRFEAYRELGAFAVAEAIQEAPQSAPPKATPSDKGSDETTFQKVLNEALQRIWKTLES